MTATKNLLPVGRRRGSRRGAQGLYYDARRYVFIVWAECEALEPWLWHEVARSISNPPGRDGNLSQVAPSKFVRFPQQLAGTHLYTWVERGTVRVKCLAQEHNTMSLTRARPGTARTGIERTNVETTAPPEYVFNVGRIIFCFQTSKGEFAV